MATEGRFERAVAAFQAGDLTQAAALVPGLVREFPQRAEVRHLAAVIAWRQGAWDAARAEVDAALAIAPGSSTFWNTRGAIEQSAGDYVAAAKSLERAVALDALNPQGWCNLAAVRLAAGQNLLAAEAADKAIALDPRFAEAWCNLGNARKQGGAIPEAISAYETALAIRPDYALVLANLGGLLGEHQQSDRAVELLQQALRIDSGLVTAWVNLGQVLQTRGDWQLARRCYEEALARGAGPGVAIRSALVLPVICLSTSEMDVSRSVFGEKLAALEREPPGSVAHPEQSIGVTPFHLAYQAQNDRPLLEQLAGIMRRVVPEITKPTGKRENTPLANGGLRVGFVSRHWHDHSNTRLMAGLVESWPREVDEVTLFHFAERDDAWSRWVRWAADRELTLPTELASARSAIAQAGCDVLIYTDVGMEPLTWLLAQSRLAPLQLTTWGVPVTPGFRTIDGYLSSVLIEPESADEQYTEPLVRLPLLPTVYPHPDQWQRVNDPLTGQTELKRLPFEQNAQSAEERAAVRRERARLRLGATNSDRLYVCPQSLFKLHPEFDAAIAEVLRRDAAGQVLFVAGMEPRWTELFSSRLLPRLGIAAERVRILPRMSSDEFLDLLAAADLLLDPWHFGGGNTSFEALALGTPILTAPGRFMRGRVTLGCYRQMGLATEGWPLVTSQAAYAARAAEIATDLELGRVLRERILEAAPALFHRTEVACDIRAWCDERLRAGVERGGEASGR